MLVTKNPPGLCAPEGSDLIDHLDPCYMDPPSLVLLNTDSQAVLELGSLRCISKCLIYDSICVAPFCVVHI